MGAGSQNVPRGATLRAARVLAVTALAIVAASAVAQRQTNVEVPRRMGKLSIDQFRDIEWKPETNYFRSIGPVRITLTGDRPDMNAVLTADDAEGQPDGLISVTGRFTLRREDALIRGRSLRLDTVHQTGSLSDAEALVGSMVVRGSSIEMRAGKAFSARSASFTTCSRGVADYRITARELRLSGTGRVDARGVTLWLRGTPVIAVPWLQKSFANTVDSPFPMPGYSKETGLRYRLRGSPIGTPAASLTYDVTASLRRAPYGAVAAEMDLLRPAKDADPPDTRDTALSDPLRAALHRPLGDSPTPDGLPRGSRRLVAYAVASANTRVYNRRLGTTWVSRTPEVGLAGAVGRSLPSPSPQSNLADATWMVDWEATAGRYRERDQDVSESRAGVRALVAGPSLSLGGSLALRPGIGVSAATYGNGNSYRTVAPEAEVLYGLQGGLTLGAAYRHVAESGTTPFVFDRSDVRHEMRLRAEADAVRWRYGVMVLYDLDRSRAFDTSVVVKHKLDCMEFGLSYRAREQGLGIIFNLFPGEHKHEGPTEGATK